MQGQAENTTSSLEARGKIPIGQVTEVRVDQTGPKGREFVYVDIGSIDRTTKRIVDPKVLPCSKAPSRARQILKTRDILVSMTRPNLNAVALVPPDLDGAIGSTGFHVLRARDAEPEFLFYAVQSNEFIDAMCRKVQGALYPAVRPRDISSFCIPTLSLAAQRAAVAEIEKQFTRLDAGVASLKRVQSGLKRYHASVLKAACEGRLVTTEADLHRRLKTKITGLETGAELLARVLAERRQNSKEHSKYKEPVSPDLTTLPPLPEAWTYASVEQLGFVQLGRQRAPQHHTGKFMRPYLRVANVFEDRIDLSDVKEMNFTPKEFKVFKLQPNDILLNEGQSLELIGRPAVYRGELPGACFTNTLVRFRPCSSLNVKFAFSVFRAFMHSGRFQKIAKWTTNIAHLGADRFAKLAFPLPPLAEQERIVAEVDRRLSVIEELEGIADANLQRASRLRQSILHRAFSGDL